MKEIEVKILEVNQDEVVEKLLSLGAIKTFEGILEAKFYDYEDKYLSQAGKVLRLRKEGNESFLTLKQNFDMSKVKICDEIETEISNAEEIKIILLSLKLQPLKTTKKKRISYKIQNTKFEFDEYLEEFSNIPILLEIETPNIEKIYEWAEKLGFSKEDCKPWGFNKLVKYYKK